MTNNKRFKKLGDDILNIKSAKEIKVQQEYENKEIQNTEFVEQRLYLENSMSETEIKITCPSYLSTKAKTEWERMMQLHEAIDSNILCPFDEKPLAMYCEAQAKWEELVKKARKEKDFDEQIKLNNEINKQIKIVLSLSDQLCLTPMGRAKMGLIQTKKIEEKDPMDELGF